MRTRDSFKSLVALWAFGAALAPVAAVPIAYDGFDYPYTAPGAAGENEITGLNGGTGWGNAWFTDDDKDDNSSFEIRLDGLSFSSLPVVGKRVERVATGNRAIANRMIPSGSHLADNATLWFSLLYRDGGGGDDDFAFTFGNQAHGPFPAGGGANPAFGAAGDAFGFASIGAAINAIEHDNSTGQELSPDSLAASGDTFLLVGKINWKVDGTPDEFFMFSILDPSAPEPAEGSAFASHDADFDQSNFEMVSTWDRPTSQSSFDEIRFGTSFDDVIGSSPSADFAITEIEYDPEADPDPTVTLTWRKTGAESYIAYLSRDLINWGEDLDDDITVDEDERTEDADHMTVTFPLQNGLESEKDLFFRIEEGS